MPHGSCARGRSLLPRVDAWQAAPELVDAMSAELGEERGTARVESTPRGVGDRVPGAGRVRQAAGRAGGGLARPAPPAREGAELPTVEALADLAAIALERTSLLEAEGRRARDELRLKRAAEAVSGSLDPDEVYSRVVEHAAAITGGTHALLTRLNARAGELRTAAQVDFSDELAAQLVVARQRQRSARWRARASPCCARGDRRRAARLRHARADRARPAPVRRAHASVTRTRSASARTSSSCS